MRSLRQLTDELLGVRMDATNIFAWEAHGEAREYARIALNDAIAAFPTRVEVVYTSGVSNDGVIVLPREVENVLRIEVCSTTGVDRYEARHWHLVPTPHTTYVRMYDDVDGRLDIIYHHWQQALPPDVGLVVDSTTLLSVSAAPSPVYLWPSTGYLECSKPGNGEREVIHYGATWYSGGGTDEGGFEALERGIEGFNDPNEEWVGSTHVSACYVCKDADLRPVMLQAQAIMYEFWLRDFALYTNLAGEQALNLEDLQILIRDLEGRARQSRNTKRRLPAPTSPRLRRPIAR